MKKPLILFILLTLSNNILAQNKNVGAFQFVERNRNRTAKLIVRTRAFVQSNHSLTFADQQYLKRHQISLAGGVSLVTRIDGREPLGTDGTIPRVEIESMVVTFSGKKIAVPRGLYADCFNPNLGKDYLATKLSDGGDSLLVFMAGSDGAGGYQVMWVLRQDGNHSRFVNNCSDCDFTGVFNFFMKG